MTARKPAPSAELQQLFDELSLKYFDGKVSASLYVGFRASALNKKRKLLSHKIESLGRGTPTVLGEYVPRSRRIYIHPLLTEAGWKEWLRPQILHEMCHAFGRGHGSHAPGGLWEQKMLYLASRGEPRMLEEIAIARILAEDTRAVLGSEAGQNVSTVAEDDRWSRICPECGRNFPHPPSVIDDPANVPQRLCRGWPR